MMDASRLYTGFFLVCSLFHAPVADGTDVAPVCGIYEEGTQGTLTCSTHVTRFLSLQPRIEIDGEYMQFGSCDSAGRECSAQPGYLTSLAHNATDSTKSVTLYVDRMSRRMTRSRCYMDYTALPGQACVIHVYIKPSKPICQPPVFIEGGTAAVITCTSDRVFPHGKCDFRTEGLPPPPALTTTVTENTNSSRHHGDHEVMCQVRVPVTGLAEKSYQFTLSVIPDIDGISESAKIVSDTMPPLQLKSTALFAPEENDHVFSYSNFEELYIDVPITGNPPPNRISLHVKHEHAQKPVPASTLDYATFYNSTVGSTGGVVVLVLSKNLKKQVDSFYTLNLSNGVKGPAILEYRFSVNGSQVSTSASQATTADDKPLMFFIGVGVGAFGVGLVLLVIIFLAVRNRRQNTNKLAAANPRPRLPPPPLPHQDGEYITPISSDSGWSSAPIAETPPQSSSFIATGENYSVYIEPYESVSVGEGDPHPTGTDQGVASTHPIANSNMQNAAPADSGSVYSNIIEVPQTAMDSADSFVLHPETVKGYRNIVDIEAIQGAPKGSRRQSSHVLY